MYLYIQVCLWRSSRHHLGGWWHLHVYEWIGGLEVAVLSSGEGVSVVGIYFSFSLEPN